MVVCFLEKVKRIPLFRNMSDAFLKERRNLAKFSKMYKIHNTCNLIPDHLKKYVPCTQSARLYYSKMKTRNIQEIFLDDKIN